MHIKEVINKLKRPLLSASICFSLGIVFYSWKLSISFIFLCSALLILSILSFFLSETPNLKENTFFRYIISIPLYISCALPICFLMGYQCMKHACEPSEFQSYLRKTQENSVEVELEGKIRKIIWQQDKGSIWLEQVIVKADTEMLESRGLILYLDGELWETAELQLYPSQRLHAKGQLSYFSKATNPGQFDLAEYYLANQIECAVQAEKLIWEQKEGWVWQRQLQQFKRMLHQSIEEATEEEDGGIFEAVFLGESKAMNEDLKELYQKSGIGHILAVSGLHVSFLALGCYQLVRRITGSYHVGMGVGTALAVLYGCMVGNPVSALRAILMVLCQMFASVLGRKYDMVSAASLALLIILCQYPRQLYQCGFLFSFLAVYSLGLFVLWFQKWVRGAGIATILSSLCLHLVLLPVQVYFYYTWNVGGILLNLVALPLAVYLLFSALLTAVCGLFSKTIAIFFAGTGHYILMFYESCCEMLQESPIPNIIIGQPSFVQIGIYYGILMLLGGTMAGQIRRAEYNKRHKIENRKNRIVLSFLQIHGSWEKQSKIKKSFCEIGKAGMVLELTVILVWILMPIQTNTLRITFLDVGQGDSIVIQTAQEHVMLVDGGSSSVSSVGRWRIEPFLLSRGVGKIDYMVMTHPDSDHYNGLQEILESGSIVVSNFIMTRAALQEEAGMRMYQLAQQRGAKVYFAEDGIFLSEENLLIQGLHPLKGEVFEDVNDSSIVLKVEYGEFLCLLTGDLSSEWEEALAVGNVSLLKAGHHGSKYSSSLEFLKQLEPAYTVISCGVNRYGHPAPEVLKRLEQVSSLVKNTREVGAVLVESDGRYWSIEGYSE
ncbi:MAG: DNA internalization-related competence protein ComEC/Rec2 [Lachnospiraceae bacterium]